MLHHSGNQKNFLIFLLNWVDIHREEGEIGTGDKNYNHYKYQVEGSTLDGDDAIIVTIILDSRTLRVVTIY